MEPYTWNNQIVSMMALTEYGIFRRVYMVSNKLQDAGVRDSVAL